MNTRWKIALSSLVLLLAVLMLLKWSQTEPIPVRIEGETMATTYHITYFDSKERNFKPSVDSLLILVNRSINTYDPTSEISVFNQSKSGMKFMLPYFLGPLKKSSEVFLASDGSFDPTVMPLVNLWGFGPQRITRPDSSKIDSIRSFIGLEKIQFNQDSVWKLEPRVQLDFSGIGQGYGADVITEFLKSKGIKNMLVELGGEGMACGINIQSGKPWELGILDPASAEDNQFMKAYILLSDRSFTTSGNYFNYREVDGKRYSHTIDPHTGFPAQHEILSASVFAKDCATADAWSTAFMVMGHEKAIEIVKQHPELDAFFIYTTPDGVATFATEKLSTYLTINP